MPNISFLRPYQPESILLKDEFILTHMPQANGTYVKVFLYAYHHFCSQTPDFSTRTIACALGLIESDVLEAFNYWQNKGLLQIESTDLGLRIYFTTGGALPPTSPERPRGTHTEVPAGETMPMAAAPAPTAAPSMKAASRPTASSKVVHVEHKPVYAPEELAIYQTNPQIQQLITKTQEALGESLSFPNLSLLYSFYDYYRLPVDVISYLVDHCIEIGGRSLRYMEKVAQDWSDNGIMTVEAAVQYVHRFEVYRPIMQALRIKGNRPSANDQRFMDRWLKDLSMPMELILEACRRTVEHTGKSSYPYTDSILEDWYNRRILTLEAVAAADQAYQQSRDMAQGTGAYGTPVPKGSFHNYIAHDDWDYEALERLSSNRLYSDERK